MRQPVPSGDVDGTEHPPRMRIVQGRRSARPLLDRPEEVLGGEHLDRPVDRECRAGRVRPGLRLGPAGALDEVHPLRAPTGSRMPLDPQQPAVRVADRQQMFAVHGVGTHELADHRHDVSQWMRVPVRTEFARAELDRCRPVRTDPGAGRPSPRLRHHGPDRCLQPSVGSEHLVRTAQFTEPDAGVRVGGQSHPGIRQLALPSAVAFLPIVGATAVRDNRWAGTIPLGTRARRR